MNLKFLQWICTPYVIFLVILTENAKAQEFSKSNIIEESWKVFKFLFPRVKTISAKFKILFYIWKNN